MELWKIIFLSKWVICRFQPLIFQGVYHLERIDGATPLRLPCIVGNYHGPGNYHRHLVGVENAINPFTNGVDASIVKNKNVHFCRKNNTVKFEIMKFYICHQHHAVGGRSVDGVILDKASLLVFHWFGIGRIIPRITGRARILNVRTNWPQANITIIQTVKYKYGRPFKLHLKYKNRNYMF